jgi:hypothetical protein
MHIHLPATSQTDFPEIQEPDLKDRYTGYADGISRHFTGEVPVKKGKTEAQSVRGRANEVLSQCQFCRATMGSITRGRIAGDLYTNGDYSPVLAS